jgi:uncharacterized membrane protein YhhN
MNFKRLSLVYLFALAVVIFAASAGLRELQLASKPLLMPLLIFYFGAATRETNRARFLVIGALFFSWLGDVALLFDRAHQAFFMLGLAAFLAAHLCYIAYFLKIRRLNRPLELPNPLVFAAIAVYTLVLFGFLAPSVGGLFYPVAVYAGALAAMLAASLAAFDFSRHDFGRLCAGGAFLFLLSDSILAVNRFAAPVPLAPLWIMLTYGLAQLLIIEGCARNLRSIDGEREAGSKKT